MKSPLKTLSRETAIYGVSTVVGRFLNFLLVPFYVNVLRVRAEYGFVSSLYAYMAFLTVILPLGLEGAYFRYAARAEGERANRERERRLFSTPFWVILIFGFAATAALFALTGHLVTPIFGDPSRDISAYVPVLSEILRWAWLVLFFDALAILPFAALRLEHRARRFALLKIGNIVGALALNLYFLLRLHWGIAGIFRANAIISFATLLALLPVLRARLSWTIDRRALAKMLPFGLANVPAYFGAMMVQVIDRPIVQRMKGLDDLAVYQANYRMGFAMMVLVSIFDYAWRPFFLRQHATRGDRAKPLFARVFSSTTLALMLAFLGLSLFLPWFVGVRLPWLHRSLLRADYLAGVGVIPIVLLAYVFQGFYTNFIAGIYITERTRVLPLVTGAGALANVAANIFLIPRYGILGAAWATLLAYAVMASLLYSFSQRWYPIRYEWGRVAKIVGVTLAAYLVAVNLSSGVGRIVVGLGAVAALIALGTFRSGDLSALGSDLGAPPAASVPDPLEDAVEKEEGI